MNKPYRILIAGIGGVGGFYAARLIAAYHHNRDYEITLLARGDNKKAIETNGLQLLFNGEVIIAHPHAVIENPADAGIFDLVLLCVKSYHLPETLALLQHNISGETTILPLQNGVESNAVIQPVFPEAKLLTGCVYIVSKQSRPGFIEVKGNINRLLFGNPHMAAADLEKIEKVFTGVGINTEVYADIESKVWGKFTFISPVATYTSAHNINLGEILKQPAHLDAFSLLMKEVIDVARKNNIELPDDCFEKNMQFIQSLPPETTSSMHADVVAGKQTEADTLTRFVIRQAQALHCAVPTYEKTAALLFQQLKP